MGAYGSPDTYPYKYKCPGCGTVFEGNFCPNCGTQVKPGPEIPKRPRYQAASTNKDKKSDIWYWPGFVLLVITGFFVLIDVPAWSIVYSMSFIGVFVYLLYAVICKLLKRKAWQSLLCALACFAICVAIYSGYLKGYPLIVQDFNMVIANNIPPSTESSIPEITYPPRADVPPDSEPPVTTAPESGSGSSSFSDPESSTTPEGFSFSKAKIETDVDWSLTNVLAEITNTTDTFYEHIYLTINFYDTYGNIIESGSTIVHDLSPGQTKSFDITILDSVESAMSYKFQIDFTS